MFHPLTWDPLTVHGFGRNGGAGFEQTPTTFPVTEPVELPPPLMLPLDQTSPTMFAVPAPLKVSEEVHDGLSVWTAAPLVPGLRASEVAVAPISIVGPAPSTCIMVVSGRCVAVAVNVVPAIEWLVAVTVRTWLVESPKGQVSVVPAMVQVGTVYRRSFVAYSFMAAYSARLTSVLAM